MVGREAAHAAADDATGAEVMSAPVIVDPDRALINFIRTAVLEIEMKTGLKPSISIGPRGVPMVYERVAIFDGIEIMMPKVGGER